MQVRIWGAILIAALAWGTTGVATRAALDAGVPPIAMAAIRAVIAAAILYVLLRARNHEISRDRSRWTTGLVAGVFQLATPFVLFTLAYQYAGAGFVGLLVALIPLATAIIAHFALPNEPLHIAKVIGLTIAFAGVAVLLLSGDSGLSEGGRPLLAAFLSVLAVISVSGASVYTKGRADAFDPIELTWMQFSIGGILMLALMFVAEGTPPAFSTWGWMLVIYLTVAGSVVPFLAFYWLLSHVSATKASLVGYVVPLIAIAAGVILLDERLQFGIVMGGVLIFAGIILTNRAERTSDNPIVPEPRL